MRESFLSDRRGKHLIIALDSGYYLLFHLNMRGQFLVTPSDAPEEKYLAAAFPLDNGTELRFHDMWRWGEMRLRNAKRTGCPPCLARHGAGAAVGGMDAGASGRWAGEAFQRPQSKQFCWIRASLPELATFMQMSHCSAPVSQPLRPAGSLTPVEMAACTEKSERC